MYKAVSEALSHEPGVVFSTNYQYMCSEAGQNIIKDAITRISADRRGDLLLLPPDARGHLPQDRSRAQASTPICWRSPTSASSAPGFIRTRPPRTEKAIILGRAAIAKVQLNAPLTAGESPVTKRALVIGGGIAGIQTALDIADAGFEVDIVEKQPTIGGKMTQIDKTFPTLDCAACILTPKMVDCAQNDKINIFAYSEVQEVKGFVGNFHVKIKKKARYVDDDQVHRLRRVHRKVPHEEGAQRVQPWAGQPPRHLHSLCAGGAEGRHHRPQLLQHAQERQVRLCARRFAPRAPSTISRRTRSWSASTARSWSPRAINPIKLDKYRRVCLLPEQGRGLLAGV